MTTNYLQMMIDSLNKKKKILTRIVELNEEQDAILSETVLDDEAFDSNMKAKGDCIDGLDRLDEGFQALFNRVRDEINNNKAMYTEEIAVMKKLITEVTELGAKIERDDSIDDNWLMHLYFVLPMTMVMMLVMMLELYTN